MKRILAAVFLTFAGIYTSNAQFYYRDIISNNQLLKEMESLRNNRIRSVIVKSFEDNGVESEGFFCEKKLSKDYKRSELFTRSDASAPSLFTSYFNDKGRVIQTRDSSNILLTINNYTYDGENRLLSVSSNIKSSDDDFTTEIQEEHIYTYNSKGIPESMVKVKNKFDSTLILFSTDENNNVSIEKDTKSGNKYFYYYDQLNRLTDVVHSNEFKEKLLPDYLFEYNNAGQISQMTATEEGGSYYYTWRYTYDNGLRIREKCYSKDKRLMGTIEYEYK